MPFLGKQWYTCWLIIDIWEHVIRTIWIFVKVKIFALDKSVLNIYSTLVTRHISSYDIQKNTQTIHIKHYLRQWYKIFATK